MKAAALKHRIIELSYRHRLSHLGSCLTAVEIIDHIYQVKLPDEKFILSAGHAGLALYVVMEKYEGRDAEALLKASGTHPTGPPFAVSTGSLGMGLPVALGMALADRTRDVYCLCSDGEMFEGSCFEAVTLMSLFSVSNLKLFINYNGYGAYQAIPVPPAGKYFRVVDTTHVYREFPFLKGLEAHYHKLTAAEYQAGTSTCQHHAQVLR
jgi:transketolase N-terminal domain/subunit